VKGARVFIASLHVVKTAQGVRRLGHAVPVAELLVDPAALDQQRLGPAAFADRNRHVAVEGRRQRPGVLPAPRHRDGTLEDPS
jgi:hypothetical protein